MARTVVYFVKLALIPLVALFFVAVDLAVPYMCGDLVCALYIALVGDALSSPIEYAARRPWAELDNPYEGEGALVVVDHQPYDDAQLMDEKSALQLSGHTHAGQLWPLQAVYRALGLPAYGEFKYPGTLLYVTAGESGWMMPLRTEEHCEWDSITLKP